MSIDFYNQWPDLFIRCGWYDFTIVNICVQISDEYRQYHRRWSFNFGLIGFCVGIVFYTRRDQKHSARRL